MKAEELMRYDWVCLEEDNSPRQVDWIRSGEVGLFWGRTVTPPYLKPIPLTAEILEKNGWEYSEYTGDEMFTWPLDDDIEMPFRLVVDYNGNKYWITVGVGNYLTPINYVHELQHALRLCGIEKEIEL